MFPLDSITLNKEQKQLLKIPRCSEVHKMFITWRVLFKDIFIVFSILCLNILPIKLINRDRLIIFFILLIIITSSSYRAELTEESLSG